MGVFAISCGDGALNGLGFGIGILYGDCLVLRRTGVLIIDMSRLLSSFFVAFCLCVAASGAVDNAAFAGDKSSKNATETIDLRDFEKIRVSGVYDITVRAGRDYGIQVEGRRSALERANIKVENNTLILGHEKKKGVRGVKKSLNVVILMPRLHQIDVSGVVDGTISDVMADDFRVNVSGVGDLKIEGRCDRLIARLSGVGDLSARKLVCNHAEVRVSGVGDATVYASESLDAHVSGIGDLTSYGSPKRVRKNRSFFSTIRVH